MIFSFAVDIFRKMPNTPNLLHVPSAMPHEIYLDRGIAVGRYELKPNKKAKTASIEIMLARAHTKSTGWALAVVAVQRSTQSQSLLPS